jgi:uncharacterized protein
VIPNSAATMKRILVVVAALFLTVSVAASQRYPAPTDMQTIHIALLYRGPAATKDSSPEVQKIQEAHLAHITKLAKEGHALIAGPFGGDGDLRGVIFLKAASADAARALEADDPAVKAGRLRIEVVSVAVAGNWFTFGPIKDDYVMRQFVFGFFNVGPKPVGTPENNATLMDDHLENFWSMRQAGTLVMAGPTMDSTTRVGVLVMAMDSVEKAKALLEQDPTVKAGRAAVELYPWYAADGIMKGGQSPFPQVFHRWGTGL